MNIKKKPIVIDRNKIVFKNDGMRLSNNIKPKYDSKGELIDQKQIVSREDYLKQIRAKSATLRVRSQMQRKML